MKSQNSMHNTRGEFEYQQVQLQITAQDKLIKKYENLHSTVGATNAQQAARIIQLESENERLHDLSGIKDRSIRLLESVKDDKFARQASTITELESHMQGLQDSSGLEITRLENFVQDKDTEESARVVNLQSKIQSLERQLRDSDELVPLQNSVDKGNTEKVVKTVKLDSELQNLQGVLGKKDEEIRHLQAQDKHFERTQAPAASQPERTNAEIHNAAAVSTLPKDFTIDGNAFGMIQAGANVGLYREEKTPVRFAARRLSMVNARSCNLSHINSTART